jgi:hypothetical protein
MGLFDIFSNDTAEKAAAQRNQGLQQGYDTLSGLYGQGRDAINTGAATATGYYQPLIDKYGSGSNAYGDASGANGAEGLQRATDTYKNSGQYGSYGVGLSEGLQALQRTHAAAGNLSSGNADTDSIKYAQDQASKSYNSYLSGLQPYLGAEQGAVSGAAGVETGQAGALNQSYQGQGNAANANYTGQGASNAAATMNNYNISKNLWDVTGKALNTGANLFGVFG